ncbi:hypothetical protein EV179_004607 [Coemansia sp. RSA 487]|nr:hypothetical protein LPJ74_004815 [Coemansia sp. RSA 1843]KAJ2086612.1 hypothetical protein IW138_005563 [Coemansia sp. RSA 986]KAJ2212491.1 hypothetical protein EV179_004607 [Coemansia sp. RSA 487]
MPNSQPYMPGFACSVSLQPDTHDKNISNKEKLSATEVLLNALANTPPGNAGDVLNRIAEGRSINSTTYLQAVIDVISEKAEGDGADDNKTLRLKPQFVSFAVCESLLDAISKTRVGDDLNLIDPLVVVALYDFATAHDWELDRSVLTDATVYLAKAMYIDLFRYLRQTPKVFKCQPVDSFALETLDVSFDKALAASTGQPVSQKKAERFDIVTSALTIDRALDIMRDLSGPQGQETDQKLCTHMIRLLCAFDRESDAEWVLSLANITYGKYTGANVAAMMAMYYRNDNAARADILFEEFQELCSHNFQKVQNVTVMPDSVSVQVEKWQLKHDKGIEKPKIISAGELWKFRSRYSAPFFRRALEHVYRKEMDMAVVCLQAARYKGYAVLTPAQLDTLIISMVKYGCLEDAFGIFTSFRSGMNASGGTGIATCQVVSSDLPSHLGLSVLLSEFGRASDWNRVWQIINSAKGASRNLVQIETMQTLLLQALSSKDWPQAIKFANSIAALVFRDSGEFQGFSSDCIRRLFGCIVKHGMTATRGECHLLIEVLEALLHKNALAIGPVYQKWNSCVLQCAFDSILAENPTDSLRLWNEISAVISKYNLSKQQPACVVITSAAVALLDSVPRNHRAVPITSAQIADNGWDGFASSSGSCKYETEKQDSTWVAGSYNKGADQLWECILDVLTRSTHQQYPKRLFKYILLTFKLSFFSKAALNSQVVNAANEVLLSAEQPIVDAKTRNLLSCHKQAKIQNRSWELKSCNGDATSPMSKLSKVDSVFDKATADASGGQTALRIKYDTPLQEKISWYKHCYKNGKIPHYSMLKMFVKDAMKSGIRDHWEPVVRDHMPKYLESLNNSHSDNVPALRQKYADSIWSQAISQYAALGEIEEAADFFRRIVSLGGYPVSHAAASLLTSLMTSNLPLPVLPKDWHGEARRVFKMDPAYPPQGTSSADLFIVPSSLAERNRIVAATGLSMLYSMLRREIWPTTYFYCVLFSVLGHSSMDATLKHIFSNVMPLAMRTMPAELRINPAFMPSPVVWTMAIKAAMNCGCRSLAEFWFREYRMSAMPIFRDDASAFSRFAYRGQRHYTRLFVLSCPYYLIFSRKRQWHESNGISKFVYDLEEVEGQLELDRLRALDKLPIGFMESTTMLTIYTLVEEHRNMESAEILAEEILALHMDKCLPKRSRPRGNGDLAFCWRMMVVGYTSELRQLEARRSLDDNEAHIIKKSEARLSFWFGQWRNAFKKSKVDSNGYKSSELVLNDEELRMAEHISRRVGK